MKEFHAYKNEDGTYRLEIPTQFNSSGETLSGKMIVSRAKLTIEPLADFSTGDLVTFIVEANNNETNI